MLCLKFARIIPKRFNTRNFRLQYTSDNHVDVHHYPIQISPFAENLAICGDLGNPKHPRFTEFLSHCSKSFKRVFFVAGNHDYDCGCLYEEDKIIEYKPIIKNICDSFDNIHFLNQSTWTYNDILIAGSTLWCNPILKKSKPEYLEHILEHQRQLYWLTTIIKNNPNKKIIVLTHFVPSKQLIEPCYVKYGEYAVSWFATDLENLIQSPIRAWLCGHSHSVINTNINGVYCGLNSRWQQHETKYIEITE